MLFFGFLIFLFSCSEPPSLEHRQADGVLYNFTAKNYHQNELSWFLKAQKGEIYLPEKINHLYQVEMTYYENGKESTKLRCAEAIQNEENKTLLLKNQVVVQSINGRTLYAEELLWREPEQTLVSEKPVKIILPSGDIISAKALTADKKLNKIVLKAGKGFHPMWE